MQSFSQSNLSTTFQIYFLLPPSTWDRDVLSHFHTVFASVFSWASVLAPNTADIPLLRLTPYMLSLHCTVHSCANSSKLESFFQNTYLEKAKSILVPTILLAYPTTRTHIQLFLWISVSYSTREAVFHHREE